MKREWWKKKGIMEKWNPHKLTEKGNYGMMESEKPM